MGDDLMINQFRQIVVWPLQLMPVRPDQQVQRHWEMLDERAGETPWQKVNEVFGSDAGGFQERHYKEFVTFLPYVQRFLYGSPAGQEVSTQKARRSINIYERLDVRHARVTCSRGGTPIDLQVARVQLYFFLDADIALLVFETWADCLTLDTVQDILFRFGRAYPGFWDDHGDGGNCPHSVQLLDATGNVLVSSDFGDSSRFLGSASRHRVPCIASHWEFLLKPLVLEGPGQSGALRYRQLEYYRMPLMAYLACEDPHQLTRAQFVRLGFVTNPGSCDDLPYSPATLADFETRYCNDSFWKRTGSNPRGDSRIIVTEAAMIFVGSHADRFFAGAHTGLLSQFRRQYLLLFLIVHFHKAALLSMSDELAVAMNQLTVGVPDSVRAFKRKIRQIMEIFLRFTHRYWFHEVSNQAITRDIYARLRNQLGNEQLYAHVRSEVFDMNSYLDSDSLRRQANTVLRLTVVTIFGLIGTIATGVLGMNIFDEAQNSVGRRLFLFLAILGAVLVLTMFTITRSKRLADVLDAISDERIGWRMKLDSLRRVLVGRRRR